MKNFNKEEFWNPLREISPAANQDFCDWIDEYKKANDWEHLFNANYIMYGMQWRGVKFHGLPIEMQIGILEKYLWEKHEIWIETNRVPTGYYVFVRKNANTIGDFLSKVLSPVESKINGIKFAFKLLHEQRGK